MGRDGRSFERYVDSEGGNILIRQRTVRLRILLPTHTGFSNFVFISNFTVSLTSLLSGNVHAHLLSWSECTGPFHRPCHSPQHSFLPLQWLAQWSYVITRSYASSRASFLRRAGRASEQTHWQGGKDALMETKSETNKREKDLGVD